MARIATLVTAALLSLLLCAQVALAEEVETDSFTLTIPQGWQKVVAQEQGVYILMLQKTDSTQALSLIIGPARVPVERFVERYRAKFERGGFTCSPMVFSSAGSQTVTVNFQGKSTKQGLYGQGYTTSDGVKSSIFMLMAPAKDSLLQLKDFLKANFKALEPKLFPASF